MDILKNFQAFWSSRTPLVRGLVLIALGLFIPLAAQLTSQPTYILNVLVSAGIYMVLAMGLNVVVGMAGLLDLGYIAFFAVGSYSMAILSTNFGWSFWAVLPVAALLAGTFGILLGAPTLPLRGDYLAIVTLGFGEIIRISLNNLDWLTKGPQGIAGIRPPSVPWWGADGFTWLELYQPIQLYYLALIFVTGIWLITSRLKDSRIGRAWFAIREDEIAAAAMGINTVRLKLLAFASGAAFAGVVGVLFASQITFISPESFTLFESVIVLSMVVLGGMGSVPGVAFGAVLLVVLPEVLRSFSEYRMLIFGLALVLVMLLRPQGLLGDGRVAQEMNPVDDTVRAREDQSLHDAEEQNLKV
ncbi:branched-chain amino acid ABC transporter permease [Anthocerotibacter panamensis]|uniref:branched-chain amino acid ABC transporter permease n=1 Tax=Anthocerotibacter panamensis TaxID=2857077 RepID=UPI001C408B56|nr:branched-chain amino acid ABC transporter permease [Anthocerotibacter panamensis]